MITEDTRIIDSFEDKDGIKSVKANITNKSGFRLKEVHKSDKYNFLLKKYLDVLGLSNIPKFNTEYSIQDTLRKIEKKRYSDFQKEPIKKRDSNYSRKFLLMIGALLSLLPDDPNHERFVKYVRVKDKVDTYEYDLVLKHKYHDVVMSEKRIRLTKSIPNSPYSRNISDSFKFLVYKETKEEKK